MSLEMMQMRRWYEMGEFRLDPEHRRLSRSAETIHLANKPFRVLLFLIEQHDRLVSRAELLETFWDGKDVYDDALRKCIGVIRKALDDQGEEPRFIETRWGEGYLYIGPLTEHTTDSSVESAGPEPVNVVAEAQSGNVSIAPPTSLKKPRWRWALAAGLALGLIVLSAVAVPIYRNQTGKRENAPSPPVHSPNSIAVLPFKNLSGNAAQEYLSDGLTESIITALARAKGLKVISRTSAFAFKGREVDVREIGRQLDVAAVLEGSLRQQGNELRVEARLVNTTDGLVLWASERDEHITRDLLTMQDEIACSVAANLNLLLCNEPEQSLARRRTQSPAAYRAYLKGRYHWYRRTLEDMTQALAGFEEATQADPQYALAYCGLAETYGIMQINRQVPPGSAVTQAKAYAQKALALDPTLARPYAILGLLTAFVDWNWSEGERLLQRVLSLDPGYAYAYGWYANTLQAQGRLAEAEAVLLRAIELDPLSPSLNYSLGETYYYWGKHERLLEVAQRLLARDPHDPNANQLLLTYHLVKGNTAEAANLLERVANPQSARIAYLITLGKRTEAVRLITAFSESTQAKNSPFGMAVFYAQVNDKEVAFEWLHRAYLKRDADLVSLKVDPLLAGLRSDARYRELLQQVGLSE